MSSSGNILGRDRNGVFRGWGKMLFSYMFYVYLMHFIDSANSVMSPLQNEWLYAPLKHKPRSGFMFQTFFYSTFIGAYNHSFCRGEIAEFAESIKCIRYT